MTSEEAVNSIEAILANELRRRINSANTSIQFATGHLERGQYSDCINSLQGLMDDGRVAKLYLDLVDVVVSTKVHN